MMDKLKLYFFLSSDLETEEIAYKAARYFDEERQTILNKIVENLKERHIHQYSPKMFNFKDWAQKYIECPVMLHPAFELRAKKELATLAQRRLSNLIEVLDLEEAGLLSMEEEIEPQTKIFLVKRIARLLATFGIWEENLSNGEFEVWQTRPYEKRPEHFPDGRFSVPWQPAAAKAKQEPEYFRQIWLNPEEDIPKVFAALERAGFIDSERKWIAPDYLNNPGGIIDALKDRRPPILHNLTRPQLIEAFGKRLGFTYEGKRFEAKNTPYEEAKKKTIKELDRL